MAGRGKGGERGHAVQGRVHESAQLISVTPMLGVY